MGYAVAGARLLGPEHWGVYWSTWGTAQILATATDLGGHLTVSRRIAGGAGRARGAIADSLRFKRALVLLSLPVAALVLPAVTPLAGSPVHVALLLTALCASAIEWLGSMLRGYGRIREESLLLGATVLAVLCSAIAASLAGFGAPGLAGAALAAMAAALTAGYAWTRRYVRIGIGARASRHTGEFARAALPTGIAILVSMGSWRLGFSAVAVWSWNAGGQVMHDGDLLLQLGYYAVAHRLLEVARFLPAAATAALLPNLAARDRRVSPGRVLAVLVPAAVLVTVACQLPAVAKTAVGIFGAGFSNAAPSFRAIALALPFLTVNSVLTMWLVATDRVKLNAAFSLLHLAVHAAAVIVVARPGVPDIATRLGYALAGAEATLTLGTLLAWRRSR